MTTASALEASRPKIQYVLTFALGTYSYRCHTENCEAAIDKPGIQNRFPETFESIDNARTFSDKDESAKAGEPTRASFKACECTMAGRKIVTAALLAGAYLGRRGQPLQHDAVRLTHAMELDANGHPIRVLCGRIDPDRLADDRAGTPRELEPPTCPVCARKLAKRGSR